MRLFIAIDIDEATRSQLAPAREAIQAVVAQARVPPRITWVKDEAAHVTLRFIGEVPESALEGLMQALLGGVEMPPFEVRWQRVGTFPQGNRPRVIWIGADHDAAAAALAAKINARLLPLLRAALPAGALAEAGESRPFKAHVTLGRIKEPGRGVDWPQALGAVRWKATTTLIDHVTMYSSRTSPKGPTYTALSKVWL